jgi:hypothetical protein
MHMLGKDGMMSSEKMNGANPPQTVKVGDKELPVITAKSKTTIKNKKTGVIYKDEAEWKALGIAPQDIQIDVKIQVPTLDLLAKTK